MSNIERQVRQVRQRLTTNIMYDRLCLAVLIVAGLWALATVVVRLSPLDVPLWHGWWVGLALAGGFTLIATVLGKPTELQAAVALDQAAGMKERISTALVMARADDPFARAAVRDADKSAGGLHVPSHIRYESPRLLPWSVAGVMATLILVLFLPAHNLFASENRKNELVPLEDVKAEHEAIRAEFEKKAETIRQLAKDNEDLKDLTEALAPLDMPDTPGETPTDVRRDAVKRIDDVKDKLRRELEDAESKGLDVLKRSLGKLQPKSGNEPGARLSQALAAGDFKGAKESLEAIQNQLKELAKNAQDPEARQKLAKMQQQLQQLSSQIAQATDTKKIQKELENKAGLDEEQAKQLMKQLSQMDPKQLEKELQKQLGQKGMSQQQIKKLAQKIQQNQQARKACQNLSQALQKAAQGCQQCQQPGNSGQGSSSASNALSNAMGQMSALEMSEQMMNELQAQLSQMESLRDSVCNGGMCPNSGRGRPGKIGQQGPNYGLGYGARIGQKKTAFKLDPDKVKTRYDSGAIIGQMLVDGPQVRGQADAEVVAAAEAELRDMEDAIERDDVPRQYDRVLREYFERLAGLVRQQQEAGGEAQ